MPRDIEIENRKYRIGTLDVFQQFHIARRLAPLMTSIVRAFKGASDGADSASPDVLELASESLADVLAEMKEEDVDYILKTCLGVVRVVEADNSTVSLYDKTSKQLRYADLTMPTMITLTINVIQDNLGSFFPTGQLASTPPQG